MNLEHYKEVWQSEASDVRITFDTEKIEKAVRQSQTAFQDMIFWRDVREVGVSLLMIPLWIVLGVTLKMPWSWYLTVPACLWIAGFMLVDRRLHPKGSSDAGEPLVFYARKSLADVEHQIWLLRNVFWWYLLPFSISLLAFFVHVGWDTTGHWIGAILVGGVMGTIVYKMYQAVDRLNQKAVVEQLEPRRDRITRLIAHLESDTESDRDEMLYLAEEIAQSATDGSPGSRHQSDGGAFNWNRVIPTWWEVAYVYVPTILAGVCVWLIAIPPHIGPVFLGTTFFQSTIAAVIAFEVTLFRLIYLSHRRQKESPPTDLVPVRPKTPALFVLLLVVVMPILALLALRSFISIRGPSLEDISAFSDSDVEHLDDWLIRLSESSYPSLGTVVVRDGEVIYQSVTGFADKESGRVASADTPYHVASVTKVFMATLAVILDEQGLVGLDEPVVKYLPAGVQLSTTPAKGRLITLRQLASHTS